MHSIVTPVSPLGEPLPSLYDLSFSSLNLSAHIYIILNLDFTCKIKYIVFFFLNLTDFFLLNIMTNWEKKRNQLGDVRQSNEIPKRTKYSDICA